MAGRRLVLGLPVALAADRAGALRQRSTRPARPGSHHGHDPGAGRTDQAVRRGPVPIRRAAPRRIFVAAAGLAWRWCSPSVGSSSAELAWRQQQARAALSRGAERPGSLPRRRQPDPSRPVPQHRSPDAGPVTGRGRRGQVGRVRGRRRARTAGRPDRGSSSSRARFGRTERQHTGRPRRQLPRRPVAARRWKRSADAGRPADHHLPGLALRAGRCRPEPAHPRPDHDACRALGRSRLHGRRRRRLRRRRAHQPDVGRREGDDGRRRERAAYQRGYEST